MRINDRCYECLLKRHIERAEKEFSDVTVRAAYVSEVKKILDERTEEDSAPYLGVKFNELFVSHGGILPVYGEIKREYNQFVLDMEEEIERTIESSDDPLKTALIFARVGNYIDFSAVKNVSKEKFIELLKDAENDTLPEDTWGAFLADMAKAKTFLILHDNCGEIVLDKLFIRQLKKRFPDVKYYAMVRAGEATNDATREDADQSGMSDEAEIITNGFPVPSTILKYLPEREREILDTADVVLSKGQANFESLHGYDQNIYYTFLCKCELFVTMFHVKQFSGMFVK